MHIASSDLKAALPFIHSDSVIETHRGFPVGTLGLLDTFFNKAVEAKFDVSFHISDEKGCVVFVDPTGYFGDIEVYADDDELTVGFGRFTHANFGCYREGVPKNDVHDEIASDVIDTFRKVFDGDLRFYGSHAGGGGYEPAILEPSYTPWFADLERFAWPKAAR